MDTSIIYEFAARNPMVSVSRLIHLYHLLSAALVHGVPGAIVEMGCHRGLTSAFLSRVAEHFGPEREVYVYDSFQGLPAPGERDAPFLEGDCRCTRDELDATFAELGLRPPIVVEGWFQDLNPAQVPSPIAFAYLDSNFESSMFTSLELVYDKLAPNGVVVLDDYCDPVRNPRAWDGLHGVKAAVERFLAPRPERPAVLVGEDDIAMAFFRKLP